MKKPLPIFLTFFFLVGSANAHEGHGVSGEGHTAKHYLTEPIHLVGMVFALSVVVIGAMYVARLINRYRSVPLAATRVSTECSPPDRIESRVPDSE